MKELTKRDLGIVRLHDTEQLSFRAIGEHFKISTSRASQIYSSVLWHQRRKRWDKFYNRENQNKISLELTLGEIVTLQRTLDAYTLQRRNNVRHTIHNPALDALESECMDDIFASELLHRLCMIERKSRVPFTDLDVCPTDGAYREEPYSQ